MSLLERVMRAMKRNRMQYKAKINGAITLLKSEVMICPGVDAVLRRHIRS